MAENRLHNGQKNNLLNLMFALTQYMNCIGYITNARSMDGIFSLVSQLYIVLNVLSFVLIGLKELRPTDLIFLMLLAGSAFFAYLFHPGYISLYNFVLTLLAYLSLPMYIIYTPYISLTKGTVNAVKYSAIVSAAFFLYTGIAAPTYVGDNATLGFSNANLASIFLFQNISVLMMLSKMRSQRKIAVVYYLIIVLEAYIMLKTNCRTTWLCLLVLCVLSIRSRKRIPKWMMNMILFAPLIFGLGLPMLSSSGWGSSITIFGKPLFSGREAMFAYILYMIAQYPAFGYFEAFGLGNAHNAYLSVLVSTGIVGFVIFFAYYYRVVSHLRQYSEISKAHMVAYVGLLLLFLGGCSEAATLLAGSMFTAASSPLLLVLTKDYEV